MKKYLNSLLFMAVALFSAATMVSCGDDDTDDPEPIPVAQNYAKYTAKLSEDIFQYFDVSVTVEVDGKKDVYTFGEDTKVDNMNIRELDIFYDETNKAGRVLEIPVFKYDVHPLRIFTDIKLNEAGKQKIANAKEGDKMDFLVQLDFGKCNEKGIFFPNTEDHVEDLITGAGTYVKTLDGYMDIINQYHKKNFDKTFK